MAPHAFTAVYRWPSGSAALTCKAHQGNTRGGTLWYLYMVATNTKPQGTTPWKHTVLQNICHLKVSVGAQWWARLTAVD